MPQEIIIMRFHHTRAKLLCIGHLKTVNGRDYLIRFFLEGFFEQRDTVFGIKRIGVHDVVRDGSGGYAKHVRNDSIKGDITNGEHVLIAVLLTVFAGYESLCWE